MKFCSAAFLALASTWVSSDAFLPASFGRSRMQSAAKMVDGWENDDFLEALSGGNPQPQPEEEKAEAEQGGSRFKEILELAKKQPEPEPAFTPIMNPFLAPPAAVAPTNPEEMSVEEQARMFREMMQNGGAPSPAARPAGGANIPAPPPRVAKTDRAGRPVGRNRDADMIANTADLYFAQLKRDSSVRGYARLRGDEDEAESVFADEGIRELDSILVKNPYLQGLRDEEQNLIDTIPEELVKPYFDSAKLNDEQISSAGISYKEKLKQRRQKQSGGQAATPPQAAAPPAPMESVEQLTQSEPQQAAVPVPVVETPPPPLQPQPQPVAQSAQQPPVALAQPQAVSAAPSSSSTTTSTPEDTKRKMRTLMGFLLKHRGGPGFGKGRLKGGEIDQFDNLLHEITGILREEAAQSSGTAVGGTPLMTQPAVLQQQAVASVPVPVATPVAPANPPQMDGMIACIEGAITMYKNSPPELKSTVMVTLRAALAAAINTCDSIMGSNDPTPIAASAQVEGTLAVIEGAVGMYRNSPPELQSSVLITLRAALKSAISTCDSMVGAPPMAAVAPAVVPSAPVTPVTPAELPVPPAAPAVPAQVNVQTSAPAVVPPTDPNSKDLDAIYKKLKAAGGEGSLGLRNDLTSEDASDLVEQLLEMRKILMDELETGIPDPEPEMAKGAEGSAGDSSTVSKYQQMLALAKAEKAGQ